MLEMSEWKYIFDVSNFCDDTKNSVDIGDAVCLKIMSRSSERSK